MRAARTRRGNHRRGLGNHGRCVWQIFIMDGCGAACGGRNDLHHGCGRGAQDTERRRESRGQAPFVKARDGTSAACTCEGRAVQKQKRKGSAKPHRRSTPENSCPNSTARRAAAVRASRMQRQSRSDKLSRCVRWRTGSARRYPHPAGAQKCRRKRHAHHRRDEPPVLQQQTKLPAQAARAMHRARVPGRCVRTQHGPGCGWAAC